MTKKEAYRFQDGDVVTVSTMNDGIFTVDGQPSHNGLTWMYSFEGTTMRCGEEYLTLKVTPSKVLGKDDSEGFTPGEWEIKWGKHTDDPNEPIFGFSIESGEKHIVGVGVYLHKVPIISQDGYDRFPELASKHLSPKEAMANGLLLSQAKNMYFMLKKLIADHDETSTTHQSEKRANIEAAKQLLNNCKPKQ